VDGKHKRPYTIRGTEPFATSGSQGSSAGQRVGGTSRRRGRAGRHPARIGPPRAVSRRAQPASNRRLISGHLHGAFRPNRHELPDLVVPGRAVVAGVAVGRRHALAKRSPERIDLPPLPHPEPEGVGRALPVGQLREKDLRLVEPLGPDAAAGRVGERDRRLAPVGGGHLRHRGRKHVEDRSRCGRFGRHRRPGDHGQIGHQAHWCCRAGQRPEKRRRQKRV
jgi:hypothetical protein